MSEAEKYLELCETALNDLEKGLESGQSLRALYNRLYYACFYASKAALLSLDIEVRSHSGIADKVFTDLYQNRRRIEKEKAAVLSRVQTKRDQSDYEIEINETMEEFQKLRDKAENFIKEMREIAEEN